MMTVKMFIHHRYNKDFAWRDAWNKLAESGKYSLATQQEYIYHRAQLANLRIAELMRMWDLHK